MSDKAAKYFLIPKLPLWPNISKSKRLSKVLPLLDPNKRNENIGSKCFSPQLSTSCWSWLLAACRQFENSSWPLKPHCFANVRCSGASPSPGGGGDPSDVEIALDVVRLVGCFDSCEAIVHSELSSGQRQTWNFWIPLAHLQNWLSLTSRGPFSISVEAKRHLSGNKPKCPSAWISRLKPCNFVWFEIAPGRQG